MSGRPTRTIVASLTDIVALATTGSTQAAGLALAANVLASSSGTYSTGFWLTALYVMNHSASNAYAVLTADGSAIPSGFTEMIGCPLLVPSASAVIFGNDFFGHGGLFCSSGISVGMSTSNTLFSSAGANFDIWFQGSTAGGFRP